MERGKKEGKVMVLNARWRKGATRRGRWLIDKNRSKIVE